MANFYETDVFKQLPDMSMHPGGLRLTDRAARLAALTSGMRAADIGCGTGATAALLSEKYGLQVVGLEISDALIDIGLKNHPGIHLIRWDCTSLPFENESLDAAFFECTLSILGNTRRSLADCAAALKKNGTVIISDVYSKHNKKDGTASPLTQEGLLRILTSTGFDVVVHEDHMAALRTYVAELREKGGTDFDAGAFFGTACGCAGTRLSEYGYTLIIARKI